MDEKILSLLIYSLDNELSAEEQQQLDQALASSAELQAEQERLLAIRQALASHTIPADNTFADAVMQQLEEERETGVEARILQLFPKVAAACVVLVLIAMLGIYFSEGSLSTEAIVGVQDLAPEDAYSYLEY
jgi:anti-sigma factor RsiW